MGSIKNGTPNTLVQVVSINWFWGSLSINTINILGGALAPTITIQ
jgi:hypothetical protein